MLPLGLLIRGEQAEIVKIKGLDEVHASHTDSDSSGAEQGRIEEMGMRVGKSVRMLSNNAPGPLLLKIDESRIAMGRSMSMKIWVRRKRQ